VDRLGRNYDDAVETIRHFMTAGVVIRTVINNMTFDGGTKDPIQKAVRDALIAFMAATAQAQAEATKGAQKAGIAHAKARQDVTKYRGRKPAYTREQLRMVQDMLAQGVTATVIASTTGVKRQTVYRIKDDPAAQEAALALWEG
jgi:putative DNA-invertase from lambdoid prophage Rac